MPYYQCPACRLTNYSAAAYSTARICPICSAAISDDSKLHVTSVGPWLMSLPRNEPLPQIGPGIR